jgi:uncharacterized repeat protein (TIGR03803 family)
MTIAFHQRTLTLCLTLLLSSALLLFGQGTYWGMTSAGGINNGGTIYTVNESGTFTKRYD